MYILRMLGSTRRKILFLSVILCCICTLYMVYSFNGSSKKLLSQPCVLPNLDMYDRSLNDAFVHTQPFDCHIFNPLVYLDKNDMLTLNHSAINQSSFRNLRCTSSNIHRNGFNKVSYDKIETELPVKMSDDFASVKCYTRNEVVVYHDLFYTVHKEETPHTIKRNMHTEANEHLNIIILGFDSVSALAFKRLMPLTMEYLRSELNAYVMGGYTKIGTNTLPNLLAALTGQSIFECLKSGIAYPQLYKLAMTKKYVGAYVEDGASRMNPLVGSRVPKYKHSIRKLMLANKYFKRFLKNPITDKIDIDNQKICFKNKWKHSFLLDYSSKFIQKYKKDKMYMFIWSNEVAHNEINYLRLADEETLNFIKDLQDTGILRNTIFAVLSDHGPTVGKTLWSDVGRLSAKMPFLALVLPRHILSQYPHVHHNLLTNSKRLTTHFDFYETLIDFATDKFKVHTPIDLKNKLPRGISLFKEIPANRSCFEASIAEHFCPCYMYSNIDVDQTSVNNIAAFIVKEINILLKNVSHACSHLHLSSIKSANIKQWFAHKKISSSNRYVVVIETTPGEGLFESTLEYIDSQNIKLLGPIERINKYENQSICIADTEPLLKPYCLCK